MNTKWKLIDVKYIDMCHFQMWEGKFQDMEQMEMNNLETYVYANVSNFDSVNFADSEVRVYAHSYENLYCPEEYELISTERCSDPYFKRVLLENIASEETKEARLCGFVWQYGNKLMAKQIQISDKDEEIIEQILMRYDDQGCTTMDASDCKLSEVF